LRARPQGCTAIGGLVGDAPPAPSAGFRGDRRSDSGSEPEPLLRRPRRAVAGADGGAPGPVMLSYMPSSDICKVGGRAQSAAGILFR